MNINPVSDIPFAALVESVERARDVQRRMAEAWPRPRELVSGLNVEDAMRARNWHRQGDGLLIIAWRLGVTTNTVRRSCPLIR